MDAELKKKDTAIVELQEDVARYDSNEKNLQKKIDTQEDSLKENARTIQQRDGEIKRKQEQILSLAERKTLPRYIVTTYAVPLLLAMLTLTYLVFIALQFVHKEETWNIAVMFFEWVKTTYFGELVGDFVYAIDGVFAFVIGWLLRKWMVNPFDKDKNELRRMDYVQHYIKNNHLD